MQARTFMSASLLAELNAIETIMTEKASEGCATPRRAEIAQQASNIDEEMRAAAMTHPVAEEMGELHEFESDFMCAICLVRLPTSKCKACSLCQCV